MNKPPAFQFYASDFLASTMDMTAEEVGAHIRALCYAWDRGPLPTDAKKLCRLMGVSRKTVDTVLGRWQLVDGGYVNHRLEQERQKQCEFRQTQSIRGRSGAENRWRKHSQRHSASNASAIAQASIKQWPNDGSPSPSPSPEDQHPTHRQRGGMGGPGTLIDGRSQRRHGQHARCYEARGLCITPWVWEELLGRLGGDDATRRERLQAWADAAIAAIPPTTAIGDKPDDWWRKAFARTHGVEAVTPTTKAARTVAAGQRLQQAIDDGAVIDPFGRLALERKRAALTAGGQS